MSGAVDYEFRTTVVRELHSRADFEQLGPWLQGARRYYLQAFVDRETVIAPGLHPWGKEEMLGFARQMEPWVQEVALRGID